MGSRAEPVRLARCAPLRSPVHDQGCGDSAAEAMPRGVVGFILGVYLSLSIAARPPVSLVGLSWAVDSSDR